MPKASTARSVTSSTACEQHRPARWSCALAFRVPSRLRRVTKGLCVPFIRRSLHSALEAFYCFVQDDGWAIASHIALSALMALFPFLLFLTAIAGFLFGSRDLADEGARLLLEMWPEQVSAPIALEIHSVLV